MSKPLIKVRVEWEGNKFEFEGDPPTVLIELEKFISKFIPTISLAKKLHSSIDLRDLAEIISPVIKISNDEIIFTQNAAKLSLSDKILSILVAKKLLGLMGVSQNDHLTLNEISELTSSSKKSASSRISELYSQRMIEKNRVDGKVVYRIALNGIIYLKRKFKRIFEAMP